MLKTLYSNHPTLNSNKTWHLCQLNNQLLLVLFLRCDTGKNKNICKVKNI